MTSQTIRGLMAASLVILTVLLTLPAQGQDPNGALRVVNGTSATVEMLRISPDYRARWGRDLLTVDNLDAGASVEVALPDGETACFFDIEFQVAGQEVTHIWGIDLCQRRTLVLP